MDAPVVSLDLLPTALAAGGALPADAGFAGANLLPFLTGRTSEPPHAALFRRYGEQFGVRQGDWKLVKASAAMQPMLVNLAMDRGEQTDLTAKYPGRAQALQAAYDRWNATMQPPRWEDRRRDGDEDRKAKRKK